MLWACLKGSVRLAASRFLSVPPQIRCTVILLKDEYVKVTASGMVAAESLTKTIFPTVPIISCLWETPLKVCKASLMREAGIFKTRAAAYAARRNCCRSLDMDTDSFSIVFIRPEGSLSSVRKVFLIFSGPKTAVQCAPNRVS